MRVPFLPEQAGASDPSALQGASSVLPLTAAEQAVFAGLLALAVQPKTPEPQASADDPASSPAAPDDEAPTTDDPFATLVAAMTGGPGAAKPTSPKPADANASDTSAVETGGDLTGAANAANAANASMIVRDMGALQPQFRAKLERVISRMKSEYGHTVSVTETYRSQARQDQLVQQGRTTSGPIVTWTNHSLHTEGRAADVQVDGTWNNPVGFAHLQEIASQEGLSTLGPRDPGHVEMREDSLATIASMAQITEIGVSGQPVAVQPPQSSQSATVAAGVQPSSDAIPAPAPSLLDATFGVANATTAPAAQPARAARVADAGRVAPVAQVAPLAQVARVAQVAQVAQVARVARIAAVTRGAQFNESAQVTPLAQAVATSVPTAPVPAVPSTRSTRAANGALPQKGSKVDRNADPATSAASGGESSSDDSSGHDDRHRDADNSAPPAVTADPPPHTQGAQQATPNQSSAAGSVAQPTAAIASPTAGEVAPVAGADAAARAAAVIAMQDARSAQPVSHMMLQLDNGDGGLDRIRVGLRGSSVGATIDMVNPTAATEVAANLNQLASALQSRGLDPDSLRVRVAGTVGTAPATDLSRVLASGGDVAPPALGTLFAQASSSSSSSRGDAQGQRPQQNPSRQRARKDQQGDQQ